MDQIRFATPSPDNRTAEAPEPDPRHQPVGHLLGKLSELYESGGRGPGTVSGGQGDPGGVSYGLFQLASRKGTVAAFLQNEGAPWIGALAGEPGSTDFSARWRAVAAKETSAFAAAQRAFVARSHYRPAIRGVLAATGYDLDRRPDPVRDVVWSTAVQHGCAVRLLTGAVHDADLQASRGGQAHDRALILATYRVRTDYVRAIGRRAGPAIRKTMETIALCRYPDECAGALAMLDAAG